VAWRLGRGLLISFCGYTIEWKKWFMVQKISGLKAQKRNPQRLNVYLDGEFAFGLSRYTAAWLQVGQELTEERIEELLIQDAQETAYQAAAKFIGYRIRTTSEIEKYLNGKGIEQPIINQVIERLTSNGLLDDKFFAHLWIENRNEFRPRSRRLLTSELKNKGISLEIIEDALKDTMPEEELAYLAAQKRVRRYEHLEWNPFYQKMGSYLARRGFSYSIIRPVIEQIWKEKHKV
jgi:regulatory protein